MGIGDMYPVILTIVIVALLIAIALMILEDFGTNVAESNPESGSQTNESHARSMSIPTFTLNAESTNCSAYGYAISNVFNGTTAVIISSGNYSLDTDTGVVTNTTSTTGSDTWLMSYTWKYGGASCVATRDVIDDIADFVPWIGVILLIIAAAIVLGILIRNLGGGSSRV